MVYSATEHAVFTAVVLPCLSYSVGHDINIYSSVNDLCLCACVGTVSMFPCLHHVIPWLVNYTKIKLYIPVYCTLILFSVCIADAFCSVLLLLVKIIGHWWSQVAKI